LKAGPRTARVEVRSASALLLSVLLASCSATGSPELELASPSFTGVADGDVVQSADAGISTEAYAGGGLPEEVASLPMLKPGADAVEEAAPAEVSIAGAEPQAPAAPPAEPGGPVLEHGGAVLTAGVMPEAPAAQPKKRGFLSAFFGTSPAAAAPSPIKEKPQPPARPAAAEPVEPAEKPVRLASLGGEGSGQFELPGVRQTELFEIKRKSGLDDDSDIDLHEDAGSSMQLAYAPGLARMAPNGLLKQHDSVDVGCLKPDLVRMLRVIESHFGKKMVVTSGYRSPSHNRKVNGAKRSMHMHCAAADVQIPGVSRWELASFARSMPGRGGVGTYCHTTSVHIDVGPERDWNWRCRRRKS
jgi:uncharacterized protein YcbK (DUF882 family)